MSTAAAEPEAEPAPPPDPESLRGLFHAPEVRNYLFAGLAALAMVFVVLFGRGSDLGGLLLLLTGAAGMAFRRAGTPPLFLLMLLYFQIFPYGLPPAEEDRFALRDGLFGVGDMILAAAVVVYVACHYRVIGLTARAVPLDTAAPARGEEKPPRRPPANVRQDELSQVVALALGAAVVGQLVWWFLTTATIDVLGDSPIRFDQPQTVRRGRPQRGYPDWGTRLLLLAGLATAAMALGRLVFGYWRLKRLSPAEGVLMLQEAAWDETRRDQVRVAWWRAWARQKRERTGTTASGGRR